MEQRLSIWTADREWLDGFAVLYCGIEPDPAETDDELRIKCFESYRPPGDEAE